MGRYTQHRKVKELVYWGCTSLKTPQTKLILRGAKMPKAGDCPYCHTPMAGYEMKVEQNEGYAVVSHEKCPKQLDLIFPPPEPLDPGRPTQLTLMHI